MIHFALFSSAAILAAFFGLVYAQKRQEYLPVWAGGWALVAMWLLAPVVAEHTPSGGPIVAAGEWLFAVAVLAFYCAARLYARAKAPLGLCAVLGAVAAAWSWAHATGRLRAPLLLGTGLLLLLTARAFWSEARKQESRADVLLGWTFGGWALLSFITLLQPDFRRAGGVAGRLLAPLGARDLHALILLPEIAAGVLMVMALYEEERRRVERNMLALSNLNLAASGFLGSGIQKMLAQGLDRVLNVVRIPAGALLLRHGEPDGPSSVVCTGLREDFCASVQNENLDEYAIRLVARLGGLVVLRSLASDAEYEALEKEEAFGRLRALLLFQGLRTVVGISLQAKDGISGVLLLGTPDHRRFTPAELRLLLALGHQIGMAVENSFLIQQTARRSEELHILNEIGRALSSTLDPDALFAQIYSEIRRLLGVSTFFVARYDGKSASVRFEIDVMEGEMRPKYSRAAGNHLIEYVVRTRQPLLVRHDYAGEAQRLGFEPLRYSGSVCAVPLILYDRPIGVIAANSPQDHAFDEGHVELLRVLASEAAIAIENARLFAEEQKKSQHLTLINNISNCAIHTLQPEEMLAKIAGELERGLSYDYVGIAILDFPAKELNIQAEAGRRRGAAGRRIAIGEGLVGRVARTGEMAVVREAGADTPEMLLGGSVSGIALPVIYGEQLRGVLYFESSQAAEFAHEEVLLLRTLADLFAGALHTAMTFQKAQEEAITDGLTGVKTHRFFMEALSSEWKRSTRAGRPFALVLMDLDRFKFVNDFYGHLEGDVVLQRVGHILEQNCRRSDVVARYGGDEFVILMPETTLEQARQLTSKLRGWIASDPLLRDKNVTASFGIAGFPAHGSTPQELIQVADSSMYLSKHQGGNAVSSAEEGKAGGQDVWKKDVLEAYLGVTLKRLFSTGPAAFEEILRRLQQFQRSLPAETLRRGEGLPPAVVDAVTALALAVDAKDQYTQGHSQKVSSYSAMIAEALGLTHPDVEEIRLGGLLHDVGKVGIPDTILNKSGPLDPGEWDTMKTHTELGARILEPFEAMERIREMILHHHEFYDGSGYPDRLGGACIPVGARVIAVADAYDTITSARAYKKGRTADDALAELARCAGNQFDPELVRVFIEAVRRATGDAVQASVSADEPVSAPISDHPHR